MPGYDNSPEAQICQCQCPMQWINNCRNRYHGICTYSAEMYIMYAYIDVIHNLASNNRRARQENRRPEHDVLQPLYVRGYMYIEKQIRRSSRYIGAYDCPLYAP